MRADQRGVSTVECLVALTLLTIAALGNAASSVYALRTIGEGNRTVRAARLLSAQTGQLRLAVRLAGGSCQPLTSGQIWGSHGESLAWQAGPVPGGRVLTYIISFPTVRGQYTDTTLGFLACQ
jgi:hypothetical protein